MNHRRWSGMLPRHAGESTSSCVSFTLCVAAPLPPPSPCPFVPRDISHSGFLSPCPSSYSLSFSFFYILSLSPYLLVVGDSPTSGTHPLPCHYVVISDNERVSASSPLVHLPSFRRERGAKRRVSLEISRQTTLPNR